MNTDRSLFEDRIELLLAGRGNPEVDSDTFRSMDEHQKRMAAIFMLENEVLHGGFSRAYFNQDVELGKWAAEGYEAIGARDHARVVRNSLEAARKGMGSDSLKARGGMLETMSDDHVKSGFAAVDKEWAAISGFDTSKLKSAYMRQHSKSFGIVLPGGG